MALQTTQEALRCSPAHRWLFEDKGTLGVLRKAGTVGGSGWEHQLQPAAALDDSLCSSVAVREPFCLTHCGDSVVSALGGFCK